MVRLELEIVEGLSGRARQHHIIREITPSLGGRRVHSPYHVSEFVEYPVHSIYPTGASGKRRARNSLRKLPKGYALDFLAEHELYYMEGQLVRHGSLLPKDNQIGDEIIPDNLPHSQHFVDVNGEVQYRDRIRAEILRSLTRVIPSTEPETKGELLDVLRRKPKSVAELRAILPPSITDRLGQGEDGLTRTVSMLMNLTRQNIFDTTSEGCYLDEEGFAEYVASQIYFRDDPYFKIKEGTPTALRIAWRESLMERTLKIQQPMLSLALDGGVLERHQSWAPPGETPEPYRLPTSAHRLLRRIFRP